MITLDGDGILALLDPPGHATAQRPLSRGELAYGIAAKAGLDVYGAAQANKVVPRLQLTNLLNDLLAAGVIIARLGWQWKQLGVTFPGQLAGANYYTTPIVADRLLAAAEAEADAGRLETARAAALEQLAQRFPDTYAQLVAEAKARLDEQAAKTLKERAAAL